MDKELIVRLRVKTSVIDLRGVLKATGSTAKAAFGRGQAQGAGPHLLLRGDRDYYVTLLPPTAGLSPAAASALQAARGGGVLVVFPGRSPVKRVLSDLSLGAAAPQPTVPVVSPGPVAGALDLTAGLAGAPPLFLLADGRFSQTSAPPPADMGVLPTMVTAARWVSARRTSTFACLFPPSAFRPDEPLRPERLSPAQADGMLGQVRLALKVAAVGGAAAGANIDEAAQLRSASLTVLSHLVASGNDDPSLKPAATAAAAEIFMLIDKEEGETARPALRAHAIQLLSQRAPSLSPADQARARTLLRGQVREAPPYDQLRGPWRFAMCSAWDFHEGECEILRTRYKFTEIEPSPDAPVAPSGRHFKVLQAPFQTPFGQPIQVFARAADPRDENHAMGEAGFVGVVINRHAQLGSFDMTAATVAVRQVGYKLMMNTQCAGLTTRFAIAKVFPDADIYSSWDSTYFNTDSSGKVTRSEGLDCFVALLQGMVQRESHAQIEERIRDVQWHHKQAQVPGFVQFIGPANAQVVRRYVDVNQDGRADFYDGFLDFFMRALSEDMQASATPRDPGVPPSQVGGAAAQGLGWAAGSLNRVVQYSDLWEGLPGTSELFYPFHGGGFFSHQEPPRDVPVGAGSPREDLGRLPAVCRYLKDKDAPSGMTVEVMFHSHLSHAAEELKRLLCAAEAMWRAVDLGYLPARGGLATVGGQRGMLLLMMAGLLEFPADQNFLDGLWSMALRMLNLPPLSRSVVRGCITEEDHDASNYYGSRRGLRQLLGEGETAGVLKTADPVAFAKIVEGDATVGRAAVLAV